MTSLTILFTLSNERVRIRLAYLARKSSQRKKTGTKMEPAQ